MSTNPIPHAASAAVPSLEPRAPMNFRLARMRLNTRAALCDEPPGDRRWRF